MFDYFIMSVTLMNKKQPDEMVPSELVTLTSNRTGHSQTIPRATTLLILSVAVESVLRFAFDSPTYIAVFTFVDMVLPPRHVVSFCCRASL